MKIFTFKQILITLLLLCICVPTNAAYIEKQPITVIQPDGEIIHCFVTGDEFYNWVHDADGFTLIRDPSTGVVVYAKLINDELVSTGVKVGSVNPAAIGLKPRTIISAEKRKQLRRDFLREASPIRGSKEEGQEIRRAGQNNGTLNNLVIYIRFSDETEFPPQANTHNDIFNKDEAGFASMYGYFKAASYGATLIPSTFYPISTGNTIISYQDIYPRSFFQPYNAVTNPNGWQGNEQGTREGQLLRRAVEAVSSQIPTSLDLDFNGDGYVDNICFVVRGAPDAWATLLWPHKSDLSSETVYINGKRVGPYNFILENGLGASVLAHEMFHTLGAPDLYRYTDNTINPVDLWDLMSYDMNPPQSSTAFMKYKYGGWIDNIPEITQNGTYFLNNVWSPTNNAYRIASPNSSTEFFVIEYRDRNVYWDIFTYGSGLIIYRVNTTVTGNAGGPPDEIYIYRPGGHSTTINGTPNNAHFSSNVGRTEFHNTSDPPCFLSNNQPGGIHILNIGASGGATMSFDVFMTGNLITATAGQGGSISPGSTAVESGSSITFIFTPNPGKAIESVLVDGENVPAAVAVGSYTFTNVMANHTIHVDFACYPQLLIEESFDNATFPPECWTSVAETNAAWRRATAGGIGHPDLTPHTGTGMLQFYSNFTSSQTKKGLLISPQIAINNNDSELSFWLYKDHFSPTNGNDRVNIYISENESIDGLMPIATYHRYWGNFPVTQNYPAWHYCTLSLPTSSMNTAYIIFEGVSDVDQLPIGGNIYLDDIKIETVAISTLTVNPTSLNFNNVIISTTSSPQTIAVSGTNLTGNISYAKGGADADAFTITQSSWNAASGGTLSVTFSPSAIRTYNATITISSPNAEDKVISLSGAGVAAQSVTGVNLDMTTLTLNVGNTEQLTATVLPENAADQTVSWSSNNTARATVSNTGLVTAISAGTAVVTVTTQDGGYTASCTVTVVDLPITFTAFMLNDGEQTALRRTVNLNYTFSGGMPTHFRATESAAALSSAAWQNYNPSSLTYTFATEVHEPKTVYTQLSNSAGETEVRSASIIYKPLHTKLALTAFSMNNNAMSTNNRMVTLNHTVENGIPALYSASESPLQVGKIWFPYVKTPLFELSEGAGMKEVYFAVANSADTSNIASAQIYLDESLTIGGNGLVAKLFPNPVENYVNVVVEDAASSVMVTVYNIKGEVYLSQTFSTSIFSVDLSRCVSGMLIVRIQSGNKYVIKNIIKL
ncbi:MAG: M6 family metalloprotease domain-containing protein [Bacteroidales bacterium]|nr:M6 family metalloprotease domain-containing protein [Bacteroidales bacterium]